MNRIKKLEIGLNMIHMKKLKLNNELFMLKKFEKHSKQINEFLKWSIYDLGKKDFIKKTFLFEKKNNKRRKIIIILNNQEEKDRTWNDSLYKKFKESYNKNWDVISYGGNKKLEEYCKEQKIKINTLYPNPSEEDLFHEQKMLYIESLTLLITDIIYSGETSNIRFLFGSSATRVREISILPIFKNEEEMNLMKEKNKKYKGIKKNQGWQETIMGLFKLYISIEMKQYILEEKIRMYKIKIYECTQNAEKVTKEIAEEEKKIINKKREKEFQEMAIAYEK